MTKMVLHVFVYNVKREFNSSYSSTPIAAVDVQTKHKSTMIQTLGRNSSRKALEPTGVVMVMSLQRFLQNK